MKKLQFLSVLFITVGVMAFLNACANGETTQKAEEVYALNDVFVPPSATLSGNYLAGRFAQRRQDWDAAQNFMGAVADFDNENVMMSQRAFLLALGAGEYSKARTLAKKVSAEPGQSELAVIYLVCDHLSRNEYSEAIATLDSLPEEGFGDYTKPLLKAWALVGLNKKAEAQKLLADNAEPSDASYRLHAGLIEELSGDMNAAAAHYKVAIENGLSLHGAIMVSRFFERYGQPEVSKIIYDHLAKLYPFNPFSGAMGTDDAAIPNIRRAAEGAGYALFDIATLLYERKAYDSAQVYGSLVNLLVPHSSFALLMMGDIAAIHSHFGKAVANYEAIPEGSPLYWLSRMRVAEVYENNKDYAKAETLLAKLASRKETRFQALVTLGDIHRRKEDFAGALKAYDEALTGVDNLTADHWPVIYARGMSLERLNNWERAEKDLLKALEFQPENPMILNFIGYSWADKGIHLDKAIGYIRKAVALRPQDGYILDSLGWALYRTGDFHGSIEWLEKAIVQVPEDSTILDHLGDAYWQVGRETEARFQWKRALQATKDAAFKNIITTKIRTGIERAPEQTIAAQKEVKL